MLDELLEVNLPGIEESEKTAISRGFTLIAADNDWDWKGVQARLYQLKLSSSGKEDIRFLIKFPEYLKLKIQVLFESSNFVAINKPWDLAIDRKQGDPERFPEEPTVADWWYKDRKEKESIRFCHQLDYATSGVLLLAKNRRACGVAGKQFVNRTVIKKYVAVVCGHFDIKNHVNDGSDDQDGGAHVDGDAHVNGDAHVDGKYVRTDDGEYLNVKLSLINTVGFRMAVSGQGKLCETDIKVVDRGTIEGPQGDQWEVTKIELTPKTGRRHQLRVTMAALGHPILGDLTYGHLDKDVFTPTELLWWPVHQHACRLHLHSHVLRLKQPAAWGPETLDLCAPDPFKTFK